MNVTATLHSLLWERGSEEEEGRKVELEFGSDWVCEKALMVACQTKVVVSSDEE
jgi:hypothetical protein